MIVLRKSAGLLIAGLLLLGVATDALSRDKGENSPSNGSQGPDLRRYIVELQDQPLAVYDGRTLSVPTRADKFYLPPTNPQLTR